MYSTLKAQQKLQTSLQLRIWTQLWLFTSTGEADFCKVTLLPFQSAGTEMLQTDAL
jgi:hypothetical protein